MPQNGIVEYQNNENQSLVMMVQLNEIKIINVSASFVGHTSSTEILSNLLVILLLSTSHALIPASLADASLVVRSNSLDVLHDTLNSSSRFVAIAIH